MQENQNPSPNNNQQTGVGRSWFIAVIAVLALVLAWLAFNRAGEDVLPTAANEVEEVQQEIATTTDAAIREAEAMANNAATNARIATARIEARSELLALQAELEAGAAYDEVEDEIEEIEKNLEAAYANTSAELQTEYQDIQQGLDSLEESIRNGTGDGLEWLANLSLMLEADVRNDE